MSPTAPPPHPPSFYIFKTPNGVRVPAAHFYADIRCRHVSREPSSKTCHCSCGPFLCGHPLQACLAGTFQQNMPLFLRPMFTRTSVAGMPRGNLPAKHAIVPAAQFYADIRCGSASQEPSSKTCHVSAMMFSLWGIGQEGARLEFLGGNCVARTAILVNLN